MNPQIDYTDPVHVRTLRQVGRNEWERHVRDLDPSTLAHDAKRSAEAGGRTKGVALMLGTYARPDGTNIYPSVKLLASKMGLGERQTRHHLQRLRRAGFTRRVLRGSNLGIRNASDRYELTLPPTERTTAGTTAPVVARRQRQSSAQTTGDGVPANTEVNTRNTPLPPDARLRQRAIDVTPTSPPARVTRAWTQAGIAPVEHTALWHRVCNDPETHDASKRALQPEWIRHQRATLAAEQKEERRRRRNELEWNQPACDHGVAAGRAPAPHDGRPICTDCRREGRESVLQDQCGRVYPKGRPN